MLPAEFEALLRQRRIAIELRDHCDAELSTCFRTYFLQTFLADTLESIPPRLLQQAQRQTELAPEQIVVRNYSLIKYLSAKRASARYDEYSRPGSCVCLVLRCRDTRMVLGLAILVPHRGGANKNDLSRYCHGLAIDLNQYYEIKYLCTLSGITNHLYHHTSATQQGQIGKCTWGQDAGSILLCFAFYFTTQAISNCKGFYLRSSSEAKEFYKRFRLHQVTGPSPRDASVRVETPFFLTLDNPEFAEHILNTVRSLVQKYELSAGNPLDIAKLVALQRLGRFLMDTSKK